MYIGLHVKYPLFLSGFNFLEILFEKILKFYEKSVQWEPNSIRRTERWKGWHDEASSRFSQFCERAQEPICLKQ